MIILCYKCVDVVVIAVVAVAGSIFHGAVTVLLCIIEWIYLMIFRYSSDTEINLGSSLNLEDINRFLFARGTSKKHMFIKLLHLIAQRFVYVTDYTFITDVIFNSEISDYDENLDIPLSKNANFDVKLPKENCFPLQ